MSDDAITQIVKDEVDAAIVALGLVIVTPLVTGKEADLFFDWVNAVDRHPPPNDWKGPPVRMRDFVLPLLRDLVYVEGSESWGEKWTDEQKAQLDAKVTPLLQHLREMYDRLKHMANTMQSVQDAKASPSSRAD